MKHIILYYSGSGNSLMIAKELMKDDKKYELRRITKAVKIDDLGDFETVGIISPVYYWTLPKTVAQVISKIRCVKYLYVITNYSMCSGNVLRDLKEILEKNKCNLNFYSSINMPETAIALGNPNSPKEIEKRIKKAEIKIQDIKAKIDAYENEIEKAPGEIKKKLMAYAVNTVVAITKKAEGTNFWVSKGCMGCNRCIDRCPRNNISKVDNQLVWGNDCDECMGCVNRCPKEAIQVGKATLKRNRYINPKVKKIEW